jgi:hypothetical protein
MPRRAHRTLAGATAVTLAASVLMLASTTPAFAADGTVTGTVFRDFNANGVLDSGAPTGIYDEPFGGVTVTAYDSGSGTWSTTTAADGTYTLNVTGAVGDQVRVEFTGLPAGFEHGAVSSAAADNGTSVQFVDLADGGDVDFAVNAPEDFSQGDAPLVTAIQWAGSPFTSEGGTKGAEPALAGLAYDDHFTGSQPAGFPNRVTLATFAEVGSVGTNVYHPRSDTLFTAATYKRQSGLGTLGLGGIYRVTDVLGADGQLQPNTGEPWLDVETLGIDVGAVPSNTERGVSGHQTPTYDPDGFANAAKVGIGGMALSADGNTLFFVNLFDRKLYALDVSDPDTVPTTFQSYDLGLGVGERPWAVTVYRGQVYVGYVESNETASGAQPGVAAATAGMEARVIAAPLSALGGAWTEVLTADLGYTKGDVYNNTLVPQSQRWNSWTDTWNWAGGAVAQINGGWQIYPQPILSDMYVDEDGYLSLGFTDRTSIQGGNRNRASDPSIPGNNFEAGASGDLLIASPDGDGTFTLENAGEAGDRTTVGGQVGQGPGNREFYDDSLNLGNGGTHQEVALGNLAGLRGTREVVSTVYDPLTGIRLAGLMWMDVDNGSPTGGYELNGDGGGDGAGGNFQKGGGLGGLSLIAAEAPVEVGNRVWFDADGDGIQDAGEPPLPGLTVNLIRNGQVVGTRTTDANGEYYFSSDPESEYFEDDLAANGGEYTIEFVRPTTGNMFVDDPEYGTVPWSMVSFTSAEPTSTETGSNPDPTTGRYTFTVGGPGENDHSIDAGFIFERPSVDIEKGDGTGTTIAHDADTMADGESYQPGETRTIVFTVTNTGDEDLREVTLTDETFSGADVQSLEWTLPDGSTVVATDDNGVLTARWDDTFGTGTAVWEPDEVITGTATLTVGLNDEPHVDRAAVSAVGARSQEPVSDADAYNAFTGDIQVIKYDGERPDPAVQDGNGDWIVPAKPLADAAQDANTQDEAVIYPVNTPQTVRWVVTNTGPTALTDITLVDATDDAPAIGDDWTADLSAFGGPAEYSFVDDGPWPGILPAGASFFAEGTLTLPATELHADTVTVTGTIVTPAVDADGNPTGDPATDPNGDPIVATDDQGNPVTVTDDDPFHARTGIGPFVDIEKGDGEGTIIANDADTMADGQAYLPGETREIVFTVTNTGDEPLRDVTLTDDTLAGPGVVSLEWTFPDGSTATAEDVAGVLTARWEATFGAGTAQWAPDAVITGVATLTIEASDQPHVDSATVTANGALSQIPVTDEDAYNAFTGDIQVIKYDGEGADPVVHDGTDWVLPAKPLTDAAQDANTPQQAVELKAGAAHPVRWVVTNTSTTWLTHLTLVDVTGDGPAIGDDWTADLSAFGGPSEYSFVDDGPWEGLLPPGASFFAEGTVTLQDGQTHADTVTVTGQVVVPAVDGDGLPTGQPSLDGDGNPIVAQRDGGPFTVTDDDPYHAKVPLQLAVTGATMGIGVALLATLLLVTGGLMLAIRRRQRAEQAQA